MTPLGLNFSKIYVVNFESEKVTHSSSSTGTVGRKMRKFGKADGHPNLRIAQDTGSIFINMGFQPSPTPFSTKPPSVGEKHLIRVVKFPSVIRDYEWYACSSNQMGIFMINKDQARITVFQDKSNFLML